MKQPLYFLLTTLALIITTSASAQVGVNNANPEQALDVEGKIKVSDDATAPSNGTIRYNGLEDDFEGYTGGEWTSLTKAAVPANPEPGMFYDFSVPASSRWDVFDRMERTSDRRFFGPQEVPNGQLFVVDQICVTATSGDENALFYAGVRMAQDENSNFGINPQIFISGSKKDGTKCLQANRTPLLILQSGNSLHRWNDFTSDADVRILVYGFFVNSLSEYFQY